MDKTSTGSAAASQAWATRRANERERQVAEVVERLAAMGAFASPAKDYAREQVARFLEPYGGPVADMGGPRQDSARVLADHGLEVVVAENGRSELFSGIPRDLLRAAMERMADGWRFHFGDVSDVLPGCRSAFLDACGPLYVESPSAAMVRAAVASRLDAFALTVMLARVEGVGGGKDKSAGYYVALAKAVLAEDAPMYRIQRVLRYAGEANVPFAVFMLERRECIEAGCDRRSKARNLCQRHFDALPENRAKRQAYRQANAEYFREYQRNYYPNWVMNPDVRADWLEYHREYSRTHRKTPEEVAKFNAMRRRLRSDPAYRQRERDRDRLSALKRLAAVSGTAAEAVKG